VSWKVLQQNHLPKLRCHRLTGLGAGFPPYLDALILTVLAKLVRIGHRPPAEAACRGPFSRARCCRYDIRRRWWRVVGGNRKSHSAAPYRTPIYLRHRDLSRRRQTAATDERRILLAQGLCSSTRIRDTGLTGTAFRVSLRTIPPLRTPQTNGPILASLTAARTLLHIPSGRPTMDPTQAMPPSCLDLPASTH